MENTCGNNQATEATLTKLHVNALYWPKAIDEIFRKPGMYDTNADSNDQCYLHAEFSFLKRCYSLLYQSLLPNTKLVVLVLSQDMEMSSSMQSYIFSGENARVQCQRIINVLLVLLDAKRNYMQFCNLLNAVTVLSDLRNKLIEGMSITM